MSFRARMLVAVTGLVLAAVVGASGLLLSSSASARLGAEATTMAAALGSLTEPQALSRVAEGLLVATGSYAIRLVDSDLDTTELALAPGVSRADVEAGADNRLLQLAMDQHRAVVHFSPGTLKTAAPILNEGRQSVGALLVSRPGAHLWQSALGQFRAEVVPVLGLLIAVVLIGAGLVNWLTRPVARIGTAAVALDSYTFQPGNLNDLAGQETEIGRLARLLQRMASAEEGWRRSLEALRQSRDELEIRVEARTRDLAEKSQQLELANQHKSEFLANMSHELRTPLNAIIGFSEVLLEKEVGQLNRTQEEYLRDVLSSGTHLLSLINDILDLAKVEAGKSELDLSVFSLRGALEAGLSMVRERAATHAIQLQLDADPGLDLVVADERKVKQILFNLLSNAVKFTPDGGAIAVRARVVGEAIEIAVSDTGIGISPADQPRVFEAFQQVGTSSRVKHEGTGLGLALAKHLVELHGGTIRVESALGQGSTFTVTLPLQQAAPNVTTEPPGTEPGTLSPASVEGGLILIVEDDERNMRLARDLLQRRGYLVLEAETAEDGIAVARHHHPDLVLMDIQLPDMDGIAALQRLRADVATAGIPVVALTAFAMKNDIERISSAGFDGYLAKPIDVKTFPDQVRAYLPRSMPAIS